MSHTSVFVNRNSKARVPDMILPDFSWKEHMHSSIFEQIVMESMGPLIVIDNNYTVRIINKAMKRNTHNLFGTNIQEGMNMKDIMVDNNFMDVWAATIVRRQPTKKIVSNSCGNEQFELSCYPLQDTEKNFIGAYGFFTCIELGLDSGDASCVVEQADSDKDSSFEQLAEYLPHLVWYSTSEGDAFWVNQRWSDFTGVPKEKATGRQWIDVIHPDDRAFCYVKWTEALQTGNTYEIRYRVKTNDGGWRWMITRAEPIRNFAGKIDRWLGTCTDIEDFVQAESRLSRMTEQMNLLMAAARFCVWSWDVATDKVICDDNLLEMFNINPEGFNYTATEVLAHVRQEDVDQMNAAIQKSFRDEVYDTEYRIQGTGRILGARGRVFRDAQGNPKTMIGINWDITQRRTLENERLKALEYAEEQSKQRIEAAKEHHKRLEEFVDTICHEIRNPLNGICGMISLMDTMIKNTLTAEYTEIKPRLLELLESLGTLEQCAQQQRVIVDDVLDLSKVEQDKLELNPTIFNPKQLVENVGGIFFGSMNQKDIQYKVFCSEEVNSSFKADSHRLSQILMNLISNAVKFTEHGSISVSVARENLTDQQCLLHFSVTDSGIGMTSEELSKLFNKFSQANSGIAKRYGGSGLGLVISKKLVERMGGKFEVESEKGTGTQFKFSVPCEIMSQKAVQKAAQKQAEKSNEVYNLSSLRALIVEDNVINQKILTNYMLQKNCSCQIANNGLEAVNLCDKSKFDVIFMDLEMPIMGGLEATRKIRENKTFNQNTPIVGLSGNARKEHKELALSSGMNEYLTKPYHKSDIYETVHQLCGLGDDTEISVTKRKRIN